MLQGFGLRDTRKPRKGFMGTLGRLSMFWDNPAHDREYVSARPGNFRETEAALPSPFLRKIRLL